MKFGFLASVKEFLEQLNHVVQIVGTIAIAILMVMQFKAQNTISELTILNSKLEQQNKELDAELNETKHTLNGLKSIESDFSDFKQLVLPEVNRQQSEIRNLEASVKSLEDLISQTKKKLELVSASLLSANEIISSKQDEIRLLETKLDLLKEEKKWFIGNCPLRPFDLFQIDRLRKRADIVSLVVPPASVKNFGKIACFRKLESLSLKDNDELLDLSWIGMLSDLKSIDLMNTNVRELKPLTTLEKLHFVRLPNGDVLGGKGDTQKNRKSVKELLTRELE